MKYSLMLWVVWYAYWIVSARNRVRSTDAAPAKRESWAGRVAYLALILVGFGLVFLQRPVPFFDRQLVHSSGVWMACGLAVEAAGLAFAIWARYALGRNWSGRITTSSTQHLVIQGPYRFVRHPIYSGLLFGMFGTAVIAGWLHSFLGVLIVLVGILMKVRREEAALREHFGGEYEDYARRVPALVPGWPRS